MVLKKHTGITYTLIGILLPFFGSVCLASANGHNPFLSNSIYQPEKAISFQNDEIPASKLVIKQDVDFIYRLKNDRFLYRKYPNIKGSLSNQLPYSELFSASSFLLVPKPAYYNYLFMFKPF